MNPAVITEAAPVQSVISTIQRAGPMLAHLGNVSVALKAAERIMRPATLLGYLGLQRRTSVVGPVVIAFAAGAAVGAGVALLLAPAPGTDTRRRVQEGIDPVIDKVRTAATRVGDKIGVHPNNQSQDQQSSVDEGSNGTSSGYRATNPGMTGTH